MRIINRRTGDGPLDGEQDAHPYVQRLRRAFLCLGDGDLERASQELAGVDELREDFAERFPHHAGQPAVVEQIIRTSIAFRQLQRDSLEAFKALMATYPEEGRIIRPWLRNLTRGRIA